MAAAKNSSSSITNQNTKKIVDIMSKIPRVGARTAHTLVAHFYAAPEDWYEFKMAMDNILKAERCVCGNIADTDTKFEKFGLCSFCADKERRGVVIVPDLRVIYRIEDLTPGKFWFHVVRLKNETVVVDDVSNLVVNLRQKKLLRGDSKNIPIINGLGNDTLSNESMNIIRETLVDAAGYTDHDFVGLPVGVPLGDSVQDIGDDTLSEILRQLKKVE